MVLQTGIEEASKQGRNGPDVALSVQGDFHSINSRLSWAHPL